MTKEIVGKNHDASLLTLKCLQIYVTLGKL
jgi:hypothetical protein